MNQVLFDVRVASKAQIARDICSYELIAPTGEALPAFSAGAHIDVHVDGLIRQYSLWGDPADTQRYLIAVLRDANSRGGSAAMHDRVQEGQILTVSAPRNHFPLINHARHSLFLAGGIGITPLLCMAHSLRGANRSFELHYCARAPERTAFRDRIRACGLKESTVFHFDDGPPEQKLDLPGVLGRALAGTHLYVCGPAGFLIMCSTAPKPLAGVGTGFIMSVFRRLRTTPFWATHSMSI